MRTILCYGDSNTWGWDPDTTERFARDTRWPGVLRNLLGEGYEVIEEGLSDRTTVWDDPLGDSKNGKAYLVPCLESHSPIDLVILMLGTNDLKMRFSVPAFDIAGGVEVLVNVILGSDTGPGGQAPALLVLAPPPLAKLSEFAEEFEGGTAKSLKLGERYRRVADTHGCAFLDTAEVISTSDIDGVHLEAAEHTRLGQAVAGAVRAIFE